MPESSGKGELLLELLTEEIPARMQPRAIEKLLQSIREWLEVHRIAKDTKVKGYVTPRRLVIVAQGIPVRIPGRREERRGPREGAPPEAIDGFRRAGELWEQYEVCDTDRGRFHFAVIQRPDRDTKDELPAIVESALSGLHWPKSMRFPGCRLRWVRPLTSVVCLFDGEVLLLPLDQVPVGRLTRGHRWLSRGEIAVENADDYLARLSEAHVVLDREERRRRIEEDLATVAAAAEVAVVPDPELLDEVTGLAEFPIVLMGSIDLDFMTLPPEVLRASMRTHQRYFSCVAPDGTPAARFLFVADNVAADGGRTIVAGNERVLRARLSDARFFWDQDRKVPLASRVEALKQRVYHEKLGSLFDKVERMQSLAEFMVPFVPGANVTRARRGALLAKADLSTGIVGEFPELQGSMGRHYAIEDGEDERVSNAIADHYKPLGPNDSCPNAPDGIVVALADKIDSLVAFCSIHEMPTGSRDPFALRRAAQGVIRLVLENRLRLPLTKAFAAARWELRTHPIADVGHAQMLSEELLRFVAERLKVHLRERGVRHDLIAAAFAHLGAAGIAFAPQYEDDLVRLLDRVAALEGFLSTDDGANLLVAYRRASNIVSIEDRKDGYVRNIDVDPNRLEEPEEQALFADLNLVSAGSKHALEREEFQAAMGHLATMRRSVDAFFDKVTVNTDDPALRENRLRLLSRIRAVMNQVADFSQIEG